MNLLHQAMLIAKDSIIGQLGYLNIYIRTTNGRVIECNPHFRVPRTIKVFTKVMKLLYGERSGRLIAQDETVLMRILGMERIEEVFSQFGTTVFMDSDFRKVRPLGCLLPSEPVSGEIDGGRLVSEKADSINSVLFVIEFADEDVAADSGSGGNLNGGNNRLNQERRVGGTDSFFRNVRRLRFSPFDLSPVTVVNRICNQCERDLQIEQAVIEQEVIEPSSNLLLPGLDAF